MIGGPYLATMHLFDAAALSDKYHCFKRSKKVPPAAFLQFSNVGSPSDPALIRNMKGEGNVSTDSFYLNTSGGNRDFKDQFSIENG